MPESCYTGWRGNCHGTYVDPYGGDRRLFSCAGRQFPPYGRYSHNRPRIYEGTKRRGSL